MYLRFETMLGSYKSACMFLFNAQAQIINIATLSDFVTCNVQVHQTLIHIDFEQFYA